MLYPRPRSRSRCRGANSGGSAVAPFDPASISNLELYLNGSDVSSVSQSGGFASQINDKNGNAARNQVQPTGATQPAYSGGVLTFDGVDDTMQASGGSGGRIFAAPAALTVAFRAKIINPQPGSLAARVISERSSVGWFIATMPSNALRFFWSGTTSLNVISNTGIFDNTNFHSFIATYDGSNTAANVHLYVDGVEVGYGTRTDGVSLNNADGIGTALASDSQPGNVGLPNTFGNFGLNKMCVYRKIVSGAEFTNLNTFMSS